MHRTGMKEQDSVNFSTFVLFLFTVVVDSPQLLFFLYLHMNVFFSDLDSKKFK